MAELVVKIDDHLASRLSSVAKKSYNGDQNAAVSDALLLLLLQPIRKDRRHLARVIDEIRAQVQATGGVTDKEIDQIIREYRQRKRAGQ